MLNAFLPITFKITTFFLLFLITSSSSKAIEQVQVSFVTEHLPPFQIAENDKVSGFATDILKAALVHTNIQSSFKVYPWTRAYNIAKKRQNTCIYTIAKIEERERLFKWVDVLTTTNSYFIGLKSNKNIHIDSIEDAKNYRVAVLRDDVTHQVLLKHGFIENKNLYIVNNSHSLLKLLSLRKSVDLILADKLTINYRARYNKVDPNLFKVFHQINDKPYNFYLACSLSTSDNIVKTLKQALHTIKNNGEYQAVLNNANE